MYQFTDECLTGIEIIDSEHRHFFDIIHDVFHLLSQTDDVTMITKNLVKELKKYALTHFMHEEEYMASINDPELTIQRMEHTIFMKRLDSIDLDSPIKKRDLENILEYLVRWLYHHILSSDMMIGQSNPKSKKKFTYNDGSNNKDMTNQTTSHINAPATSKTAMPLSTEPSKPIMFTKEYLTGIDFIDDEHKKLFEIIHETEKLVQDKMIPDKYDHIMMILQELKNYTHQHFEDEEAYMEKICYDKLDEQKKAHRAFIEKLVQIDFEEMDYIDDNQQEYLEELVTYLLDWLIIHIIYMDKLIPNLPEYLDETTK